MRITDRKTTLAASSAVFLLLALAHRSLAQTNGTRMFQGKASEFTIAVPTNWAEMPAEQIEALLDPYAEDYSPGSATAAHYGYGPPISDAIPNPPYIAVDVRKFRRLPERIVALHRNDSILKTNLTRIMKKSGILETNILEISYDTNKYMVRVRAVRVAEITHERLCITRLTFFTQEGSVGVTAVCPEPELPAWTNSIQMAFNSFQLADRLRYRPRAPVALSRGIGLQAFLIGLVASVVVPVACMIYNRRSGEVMSDEI
jgi:hypothetical protein